jgi:septal ring factor EnvC (AmiA/AmiB activator)
LILFVFQLSAQETQKTKAELEQEKQANLKKIAEAEKILTETESQKKATIGQLTAVNQQISARESLIRTINDEINLLNSEISDLNIVTSALQRDLKNLKEEYAKMIYSSYKANRGFSILTFIFSAETFNQLFMRLKYLEQYSDARKLQAQQIEIVTEELQSQLQTVESKRSEQEKLLAEQVRENNKLIKLKNRQGQIVAELNKKEKQLRDEMADRKKAVDRLDKLIASLIKEELEKSKTVSTAKKEDEAYISTSFEQNKAQLKWPVSNGFVSSKFGRHPHPLWKNITVDNPGIEIQTSKEEEVVCVFDGEVKIKAFIPQYNNVVVVKHGNYFTVYSRLKEVYVEKGQKLQALDKIGRVATNSEGVTELHFEVWKNTQKVDPEQWLVN